MFSNWESVVVIANLTNCGSDNAWCITPTQTYFNNWGWSFRIANELRHGIGDVIPTGLNLDANDRRFFVKNRDNHKPPIVLADNRGPIRKRGKSK